VHHKYHLLKDKNPSKSIWLREFSKLFRDFNFLGGFYTVCHNYRNPNFQGQKFSQYAVYMHKNFWAIHEIMLREVIPELSTVYIAFTM